jgi:hypothetical protein
MLGGAARRVRQSDQWNRGNGNALAIGKPNPHTVPIANGRASRSRTERGRHGDDPGGRVKQSHGLHLQ